MVGDKDYMSIEDSSHGTSVHRENVPAIELRLSTYPSSVEPADAIGAFDGTDQYVDDYNKIMQVITSKDTARDLLLSAARKYVDDDYAERWMAYLDKKIDAARIPTNSLERFSFSYYGDDNDFNLYTTIENQWIHHNELDNALDQLKYNDGIKDMMKGATDSDWSDALVLNVSYVAHIPPKTWQELIDDLMLIYMGIQIYAGVKQYGKIYCIAK